MLVVKLFLKPDKKEKMKISDGVSTAQHNACIHSLTLLFSPIFLCYFLKYVCAAEDLMLTEVLLNMKYTSKCAIHFGFYMDEELHG